MENIEKGATAAPFFSFAGEVSLAFLAGLLLPALGFLCHCLLSPPSSGFDLRGRSRLRSSGCRLARTLEIGALRFAGTFRELAKHLESSTSPASEGVKLISRPH